LIIRRLGVAAVPWGTERMNFAPWEESEPGK
jgi:hypothetical protein